MNEREALKLALEALDCICSPLHVREIEKIGNAMKAIREALAQPDQEPVAWMREDEDCTDCIVWEQTEEHTIPLYTAPPQRKPEQEPVAWNVVDPTGKIVATEMNSVRGWARIEGYKKTVEGLLGFHEQGWRVVPTTPPQREWVGLTDEEKHDCYLRIDIWSRCYEMIEAKLREKNG